MTDTAPASTAMIRDGITEHALLAAVAGQFPNLERMEFVAAPQDARATTERLAVRRH